MCARKGESIAVQAIKLKFILLQVDKKKRSMRPSER